MKKWIHKHKALSVAAVAVLAILVGAPEAYGLFGIGDVVFDPTSYATLGQIWSSNASTYVKMEQEVVQSAQILENGLAIYNLGMQMAQRIMSKSLWVTAAFAVADQQAMSQGGPTPNWAATMNGLNNDVRGTYSTSVYSSGSISLLGSANAGYNIALQGASPQNSRLASNAALLQMIDQANVQCGQTIGTIHANQAVDNVAFNNWLSDNISNDDARNSMVAVMNVMSGGQIHGVTEAKKTTGLASCQAQLGMQQTMEQRNRIAQENAFYAQYAASKAANPTGADPQSTANSIQGGWTPE